MACVILHMFIKYRSQAENMHNISKICMITIAYICFTAKTSIDCKSDSGGFSKTEWKHVFLKPVLKDSDKKVGFDRVGTDEKKEFFLTGVYS